MEKYLHNIGPKNGATNMGLFAAISAFPVHNTHTAYTAFMQPGIKMLCILSHFVNISTKLLCQIVIPSHLICAAMIMMLWQDTGTLTAFVRTVSPF